MAPLQGDTLGQRHKYYNQLVKEAIAQKSTDLPKISYNDDDVDNMIKIDIACSKRNVDYILDVFKCEDMLYVSKAIKKSTWLITDPQYAHLINPKYLHSELFPQMNAKAITKLMLHIRRHLKDETRVSNFYTYVNETKPEASLRWLQNCSVAFIETIVNESARDIPLKLMKRILRKHFNILQVFYNRIYDYWIYGRVIFLIKSNCQEFLNMLDGLYDLRYISFNANYTNFLMKKCPQRILSNMGRYINHIDLKTFVKFIKEDELKSFVEKHWSIIIGVHCYHHTDIFEILSPFLIKMQRDKIIPLLRTVLYNDPDESYDSSDPDESQCDSDDDKSNYNSNCASDRSNQSEHSDESDSLSDVQKLFYALERETYTQKPLSFKTVYRWFQFVPFDIAFAEIVPYIVAESSPELRNEYLIVILTSAGYDMNNLKTALQYYCDKHANEINMYKIKFVNSLLSQHNVFRFDEDTWNTLNTLFHSLGVYAESECNVQMCLAAIIVYKVLNDQPVPKIVEDKFEFQTLKNNKFNLNNKEQDKLFNYLYNLSVTKLQKQATDSESGMHASIELLKNVWTLITVWRREATHHQIVVDKIAELGNINKASTWFKVVRQVRKRRNKKLRRRRHRYREAWKLPEPYINLPFVYKMVKSYRKTLFESSLVLHPGEEVCLNALKHDPGLLARHKSEMDYLRCDSDVCLKRFLRKLRIYWSDSLAVEWLDMNLEYIQNIAEHRALVRGIIVLMPQDKLINYVKKYTPEQNKVQWNDDDEIILSLRKHIAKHMHLARPQLPAEVVLWYAKGDYLQYALLSLNTLYYNLRSEDIKKYIEILLKAPVSLRKHGIRLAFAKFTTDVIIDRLPIIWKTSRNVSIRAISFIRTYNLLCNENDPKSIQDIWVVLNSFIDQLNEEENKEIYKTLGQNITNVPKIVVGECFRKSYLFLKSLPPKVDLANNLDALIKYAAEIIEYLDCNFVENSLLGSIYDIISTNNSVYMNILTCYLLNSKNSEMQIQKYNNLVYPVIEQCVPKWALNEEENIKHGIQELLVRLCKGIPHFVFEKKMVMPVEVLESIHNTLKKGLLRKHHDYQVLARWRLTVAYVKLLDDMMNNYKEKYEETDSYDEETDSDSRELNRTYKIIRYKSTQELAKICVLQFTNDVVDFFPSVYLIYNQVFSTVLSNFGIVCTKMTAVLNSMLDNCENRYVYLLLLKILPNVYHIYGQCRCITDIIKRKIYNYCCKEINMHYFLVYDTKYEAEEIKYDEKEEEMKMLENQLDTDINISNKDGSENESYTSESDNGISFFD